MRLLFVALIIIANHSFAQGTVTLSGKIQNTLSDSIEVSYNDNRIAYYPKEFFAHIDKKGNFSLQFPVPSGIYIQAEIKHGNKLAEIILHEGDKLTMTVNAAHLDSTIHYKGRGSEIQNFIELHALERGRMNQYTSKLKSDVDKEPADFLKSIEKEKSAETSFLNTHKEGLPQSFIKYWTAYYQYYNYFFMQQYPQMHVMVKLRRYTDTIPEINYSVLKEMPYAFSDTLLQVPPYLLYLTGVFDSKLKAAGYGYMGKDTLQMRKVQDSVNSLGYKLMPDKSAEYFTAQNIYGRTRGQQLERTQSQLADFKKHWPESEYLPILNKQVSLAEKLAPGQPAADFDIITPDGKTSKLSDLRGKVVYLGFWASWCRQCVGEMMSEYKIKDLVKDKPLEFVYVSIDNDKVADSIITAKYKIGGIFTHAEGEWLAEEVQLYGVQSLPAYYLIDEDGNFALQNPPTPMQPTELILEIEKLFK